MSKREKRLRRIRQNPKNVTFDDLCAVLEDYGFSRRGGKGTSHYFFRAEIEGQVWTLTIPFHRPVNQAYVKEALAAIDQIRALADQPLEEESSDDEPE